MARRKLQSVLISLLYSPAQREGLAASCQTGLAQEVRGRRLAEISGARAVIRPRPSSVQASKSVRRASIPVSLRAEDQCVWSGGMEGGSFSPSATALVHRLQFTRVSSNPPGSPQHPSPRPPMSSVPDLRASRLFDVKGKVVLVTGGGGGIGLMQAAGFVSNGARGSSLVPPHPIHSLDVLTCCPSQSTLPRGRSLSWRRPPSS